MIAPGGKTGSVLAGSCPGPSAAESAGANSKKMISVSARMERQEVEGLQAPTEVFE